MPGAATKKKPPRAPRGATAPPTQALSLETVPLASLNRAPYNPRVMDPEELAKLKESLLRFGWLDPLVVNRKGRVVVGGHQRLDAAAELGWTEAPVFWVGPLDEPQEIAANAALNKIAGRWDFERLADALGRIQDHPELLAAAGFDGEELEELLGSGQPPPPPVRQDAELGHHSFAGADQEFRFGSFTGTVPEEVYAEFKRRWEAAETKDAELTMGRFLRGLLGMTPEPHAEAPPAAAAAPERRPRAGRKSGGRAAP